MRGDADGGRCQFRIRMPPGWSETVVWQLQDAGFGLAIAEERAPAGVLDEEDLRPVEEEVVVVAPAAEAERLRNSLRRWAHAFGWSDAAWSLSAEAVDAEDPEQAWRRRWKPFRCAGFVVHAPFHEPAALPRRAGDVPLEIGAGGAFGTGGHASTRMGLRAVRAACATRPPRRVLDVGTGSGILAVAAALLGAERVAGMDPDPRSPVQARAAARANGVAEGCRFWRGRAPSATGRWDLVLANLVADLLLAYADLLVSRTAPGGLLFAGGILDRKEEVVAAAWAARGLRIEKRWSRGRWRALVARVG